MQIIWRPVNSEFKRIQDRNNQYRTDAVGASIKEMEAVAPADFEVHNWSRSIEEMYRKQWEAVERHPDGGWDWPAMRDAYRRDGDSQIIAIKSGDRLAALALITVHHSCVKVAYLEGDPREDCPLREFRTALALDIAARYGQKLGKKELRLEPVNSKVRDLYVEGYLFEEVAPAKGEPYLKRDLEV